MNRIDRGFTLLELMVVIMILGVLATVAINLTLRLQERAYVNVLQSDLSSAYKASIAFHMDHPGQAVDKAELQQYGYRPSAKVSLEVIDGFEETLLLRASRPGVTGVYEIDSTGRVIEP